MSEQFHVKNHRLSPSQVDELAKSYLKVISRPIRSKIIYTGLLRDDAVVGECHRQRIIWLVDQLRVIMPELAGTLDYYSYKTLDEAQTSLNDLNNITYDISDNIMVLKHILTWELQMTEEMNKFGVLPEEIPSVVICQEAIRDKNREFAKKSSSEDYRASTSLLEKRKDIISHDASIRNLMIPLVKVLSLRVSDVSSKVLLKSMREGSSLGVPDSKKFALECLKKDLVIKAREATLNGQNFVIKDYLA